MAEMEWLEWLRGALKSTSHMQAYVLATKQQREEKYLGIMVRSIEKL